MKISVGQFRPGGRVPANVATMRELAGQAVKDGSELIVFPEESMFSIGKVEGALAAVDAGWSVFVQQLSFLAAELKIAVVAGGYESSGEERPYNTLVLIDATGRIADTYRKLHLYDAFSYSESQRIKPGDGGITVVPVGSLNVGLMTCYDLRFPRAGEGARGSRGRRRAGACRVVQGGPQDRALGDAAPCAGHREYGVDCGGGDVLVAHDRTLGHP